MKLRELAEAVMPSETYCAVTYDSESHEVGIQYGYALISIPQEDLSSLINLLQLAGTKLKL